MSTAGGIGAAAFASRLDRVQAELRSAGAGAVLAGVGPELEWLLGYAATGLERLNLLVLPAHGPMALVVPRLEVAAARAAPGMQGDSVEVAAWAETDDPFALVADLLARAGLRPGSTPLGASPRLLVSDGLRAAFLLRLQGVLPWARWERASLLLGPLRRAKDTEEVALLAAAAAAADRTVMGLLAGRLVGRTEADVAHEVAERLVTEGHSVASFTIVASGPHSASPHHEPGRREVRAGEPLLLDIGGRLGGYCSDITRTVWVAGRSGIGPDDGFRAICGLVQEAQAAGRTAVRPGVALEDVDRAARSIIEAAGHGEHFFHRLGHGIGLEVHEEPYLVAGDRSPLQEGDAFSIEPGVYLDGRYGVRIEDIVVCTPRGGRSLNEAPRELLVVRGE